MASTAAERKAKQRQEMLDRGFTRKDLWLSKESIELIEKYKSENNLKSNDEAINQIVKEALT
jgi:NTP pyrophosphatase (non-canonical NTP hydrolase)